MQFTYAPLSVPQDKLGGKRRPLFLRRNIRNKANQVDGAAAAASTIGPNGMIGPDAPPTTTTSATPTTTTLGGIKEENSGSTATATTKAEENKTNQDDSGSTGAATAAVQPSIAATTPTTTATTTRSDYQIVDNTEVKLNMNSYKMVWVTNKHGLFYKRNSISKARKVSANDDDDNDIE